MLLESEVERLQHIIDLLKRGKFGSNSEKILDLPPDQLLFNELEVEAKSAEPEQTELIEGYTGKKKGRRVRKPFPERIPREEVVIDLPEAEKICPTDGTPLIAIGFETTEKLKITPIKVTIVVEKKIKYGCGGCKSHMAQAKSNSILPGTIASVEFFRRQY